jgi:hypothetical protein
VVVVLPFVVESSLSLLSDSSLSLAVFLELILLLFPSLLQYEDCLRLAVSRSEQGNSVLPVRIYRRRDIRFCQGFVFAARGTSERGSVVDTIYWTRRTKTTFFRNVGLLLYSKLCTVFVEGL